MRALTVHGVAVALVFLFVNAFTVWQALGAVVGVGMRDVLPWIAAAVLAVAVAAALLRKPARSTIDWRWLAAAAALAALGLAIPDPAFPGKRVHVVQYFILACVVWQAVPARHRTPAGIALTLLAVALYGVHDEFLQGFHPRRTFGIPDMTVNLCGAASGICTLLAMAGGPRASRGRGESAALTDPMAAMIAASGAAVGVCLFAWAATHYRHDLIPYWSVLPALAGAFWVALVAERTPCPGDRNALRAVSAICALFVVYPLLTDVAHLDFA